MQEAFGIVIFAVVALGAIAALASLLGRSRLYDEIGRGSLSLHTDPAPRTGPGASRERDEEIRQLLTARNARRATRGEVPQDVEDELADLLRPQADPGLRREIRDLVVARNARRVARGDEPLDVEAEVERQLAEL